MAAIITIPTSGNAVATGGKTVTFNPASGTAPYSITDATGITLTKSGTGGEIYHATGATCDGTTVTVTFDTIIPQSTTVTLAVGTGSNLTDSAANTVAASQTGRAVTNNSTQVASATFGILTGGAISSSVSTAVINLSTTSTNSGHTYVSALGSSEIEFRYTGTDLSLPIVAFTTGPITLTVDGTTTTPTVVASAWILFPILSGASDTTHTIKIQFTSSFHWLDTTGFVGYGTGTVALPTGYGKSYSLPLPGGATYIRAERPYRQTTFPLSDQAVNNTTIAVATTGGTTTHVYRVQTVVAWTLGNIGNVMVRPDGSLWLFMQQFGGKVVIHDGLTEGTTLSSTLTSGGSYGWTQVASGLDATAVDETATITARRSFRQDGDSIVGAGSAGTETGDTRPGMTYRIGRLLDMSVGSKGTSGAVTPTSIGNLATENAADVQVLSFGTNDLATPTSQATFTSNWQSLLANVRTNAPSAKIIVTKILPRTDNLTNDGRRPTYNGYIATAIANVGDANTYFVDISGGFDPTSGVGTLDGIHPNDSAAGYTPLARNLSLSVTTAAFATITNNGDGTLTLTLANNAVFSTGQTVTLTASAGTINVTVTGSTSGNNTGAVTVTPDAGESSFTFAPSGTMTITYTSGQGAWTNPGATSYSGNSAPDTPTGLTATAGDGQIVLTWDANAEIDLADYQIYHATSLNGTYAVIATINSPSGSPATTYTHSGLTNGVTHYYKITARDTTGNESASSAAVSATPESATSAEGYYAKHIKMQRTAGVNNLAAYSNLDSDGTDENETYLQASMDAADRYVDTRARVLGCTADTGATGTHLIATDNVYFDRVSDLASQIAVADLYRARGFTGDNSNTTEGQMADMDAKAKAELDTILKSIIRDDDDTTNDVNTFQSIPIANQCGASDENGGW